MSHSEIFQMELNGVPVQVEDFKAFGVARSYGHFTTMTVQDRKVRGFSLHLDRLQRNAQILYGCGIDPSRVRAYVRHALDATTESTLEVRVDVFSRGGGLEPSERIGELDIMTTVRTISGESSSPVRVQSTRYERDLPQVKHVGTFGLNYQYHLARLHGFDDALFIDAAGRISEGSTWNVGFFDGQRIIWPDAPVLPGITMQLVQAGLKKHQFPFEVREVRHRDLSTFRSAFLTNCRVGIQAIASIDEVTYAVDSHLHTRVRECYETNILEEV